MERRHCAVPSPASRLCRSLVEVVDKIGIFLKEKWAEGLERGIHNAVLPQFLTTSVASGHLNIHLIVSGFEAQSTASEVTGSRIRGLVDQKNVIGSHQRRRLTPHSLYPERFDLSCLGPGLGGVSLLETDSDVAHFAAGAGLVFAIPVDVAVG